MASSRSHPPFKLLRVYNVMGLNHVKHVDTNHELVRWRFIIIAGVDGFRRLVTFLKSCENNMSRTDLECFLSGVNKYKPPLRVHKDLENVSIADFIKSEREEVGMITGTCTYNQRIEILLIKSFLQLLPYGRRGIN